MSFPPDYIRGLLQGGVRPEDMPVPSEELLSWLERVFPPECYNPREGTLEDHLKYAGKVELIASMRLAASRTSTFYEPPEPLAEDITVEDLDAEDPDDPNSQDRKETTAHVLW